jgi:rhodanese-related sulfurtransferase
MKKYGYFVFCFIAVFAFSVLTVSGTQAAENPQIKKEGQKKTVHAGVDISTEELKKIRGSGKIAVIDVRPKKEFEISHIPGSVSIFENDIAGMVKASPDKSAGPVLYCNGPYCHKTLRVADKLAEKGYKDIKRYRNGLPLWRAEGNAAETSIEGFKYVYAKDKTAVFVDARSKEEFSSGTILRAVNLRAAEIEAANNDGRLPYTDHGARIIVFGSSVSQARQLAEAISKRAYWSCSYLAGTYEDIIKAGLK